MDQDGIALGRGLGISEAPLPRAPSLQNVNCFHLKIYFRSADGLEVIAENEGKSAADESPPILCERCEA